MDQIAPENKIILWCLKNAVKTQIYIAIITYTVVAIIKAKLKLKQSPYEILHRLQRIAT